MTLASHREGINGSPISSFFPRLLFECAGSPLTAKFAPSCAVDLLTSKCDSIPFLSPPNVTYPDWLCKLFELGTIDRSMNKERVDFNCWRLYPNKVKLCSGESKDYGVNLELEVIKKIIQRVPVDSPLHIVYTNSLQNRYFVKPIGTETETETENESKKNRKAEAEKETYEAYNSYVTGFNNTPPKKGKKKTWKAINANIAYVKVVYDKFDDKIKFLKIYGLPPPVLNATVSCLVVFIAKSQFIINTKSKSAKSFYKPLLIQQC